MNPLIILLAACCLGVTADEGKHFFLLYGQSNMSHFQQRPFFIPAMQAANGEKVFF
jgi:hypothetical protein